MGIIGDWICHITGENDSGKTTFIIDCGAPPSGIALIGADVKEKSIARELEANGTPLGLYIDAIKECGNMKESGIHKWMLELLDSMRKDVIKRDNKKYDVLGWDNWPFFEQTFFPYVSSHMNEFRENWSPKGDIKGSQTWISSFDYESRIIDMMHDIARMIIFTTPIKEDRTNGIKTGKMISDCKKPMVKNADLRIWLRGNPKSAQPIGLVLKRPSKRVVTDEGIRTINVLPKKLDPCTWERIKWYWDNPIGERAPLPEETPDEYELSVISNVLSKDQMKVLEIAAQIGIPDLDEYVAPTIEDDIKVKAKQLRASGKSVPDIAKELQVTPADIVRALQ